MITSSIEYPNTWNREILGIIESKVRELFENSTYDVICNIIEVPNEIDALNYFFQIVPSAGLLVCNRFPNSCNLSSSGIKKILDDIGSESIKIVELLAHDDIEDSALFGKLTTPLSLDNTPGQLKELIMNYLNDNTNVIVAC